MRILYTEDGPAANQKIANLAVYHSINFHTINIAQTFRHALTFAIRHGNHFL